MKVIIVLGLPGSGKSFLASRLAQKIDAIYVSSDQIRKKLLPQTSYSEMEKEEVYKRMLPVLDDAIKKKKNIIMDATFYKNELRQLFLKKCKETNTKVYIIEVIAQPELIHKRLSEEREDSDADFDIYKKIIAQFDEMDEDHLILESEDNNIDAMVKKSLDYISND